MKLRLPALFWIAGALLSFVGCAQIDLTPEGDPNRVLDGAVVASGPLPAGAEIVVRLLDPSGREAPRPASHDIVVAERGRTLPVERVVGEQTVTLAAPTEAPVPFRIAYEASDALMRRGLTVDVRISYGGRVRYRTISAHIVTLASALHKHDVFVQPLR